MSDVEDLFDDPGSATKVEWETLNGRLLMFYPKEKREGIETDYGTKEAIASDLVVLDGDGSPKELNEVLVFPLVLMGQLRNTVGTGRPVVGRLEQGELKKGNRPWQLRKATDAEKQIARDYINKRPTVSDPGSSDLPF